MTDPNKGLKLNQVIALEKGVKSRAEKELTAAHHALKKPELLTGLSKTYKPKNEEGEERPPENKLVSVKVPVAIEKTKTILADLFDITAQKDFANCNAKADVVVDEKVLVKDAPIPYLLWLEKQLVNIHTFVRELPVLSTSEKWTFDTQNDLFRTDEEMTQSTKKEPKVITLAPATDKHPAQTQLTHEDVVVGYWLTTKFSGCIPETRRSELLARVEKLQSAVKIAREAANMISAEKQYVGKGIMDFLFSP